MSTPAQSMRLQRWLDWLIFAAALISAVSTVGFPLYVIRPFRYQGPTELGIALTYLRQAPWVTIAALVVILLAGSFLWRASARSPRVWVKRALIVLGVGIVALCAIAARINVFEKMFHP